MIIALIEFVILYVLCYLFYLFFVILKKKKNKFNSKKLRVEESFLIGKYKIDFKKFKKKEYRNFLHIMALTNSFIISLTFIIVGVVKGLFFKLLLSVIILVPLILVMYMIIGKYYQKKGLIKDV